MCDQKFELPTPDNLQFNFPDSGLSKDEAMRYTCIFYPEYSDLKYILDKQALKVKIEEVLPESKEDDSFQVFVLYSYEQLLTFCRYFGFKQQVPWRNSLGLILQKSAISYAASTLMAVYPQYAASFALNFGEKEYLYQSCSASFYNSTQISHLSFNQPCGNIPLDMYSKDYPYKVGSYSDDSTTVCKGIPSGVLVSHALDAVSLQQYVIYFLLALVAFSYIILKYDERIYIRISNTLGGVYMRTQYQSKGKQNQFFNWLYYNFDVVFLCILSIWYLTTLVAYPEVKRTYWIVPSIADRNDFKVYLQSEYRDYISWCNSLNNGMAVKITYVRYLSTTPALAILQLWLFFTACYNLIWSQRRKFDWIDNDEYMDAENKVTCLYYNIHQNRDKIFTENILKDWLTIHIYYKIGYYVLYNEEYSNIKSNYSEESLQTLKTLLVSVVEKYMENPMPFDSLKRNPGNDDNFYNSSYSTVDGQASI